VPSGAAVFLGIAIRGQGLMVSEQLTCLLRNHCCVLVDGGLLKEINSSLNVAIATLTNFSHAKRG
jgi:hypothetical protein